MLLAGDRGIGMGGLTGGHFPQPFDDRRQDGDDVVDLVSGVGGAEAESDRSMLSGRLSMRSPIRSRSVKLILELF